MIYRVTTGKLKTIDIPGIQSVPRSIPLEGKMKELAVAGMMSIVSSCDWVARPCDPGHSVHASMMQQKQRDPTVEDVEWANQVAMEMAGKPDRAIVFRKCFDWSRSILVTVGSCAHANKED